MKLATLIPLALLLPAVVHGQHWTSDEQSLIAAIEQCWERGANDPSMTALTDGCRATEATIYWWTPENTPNYVISAWTEGARAAWNRSLLSQDLRPVRVRIDGDFGFIYYHGIRLWELDDGVRETESWKGFEVWKRTPQGWSFDGGTGTPDAINQVN